MASWRLCRLDWLTLALLLLSLVQAVAMLRLGMVHDNDFKHIWLGSRLLEMGHNPYDPAQMFRYGRLAGFESMNPYVYLPTTGLLMKPLAALPYPAASTAWFWLNWTLAWAAALLGPGWLRVDRPAVGRLAGAAFLAGSMPFFRQMTAGQMNVIAMALLTLAGGALLRRKGWLCALAIALGFGWKISPALLGGALLVMRKWRAAAWAVLFGVGLLGLSIFVYGAPVHREAIPVMRQMSYGQSTWSQFGNDFYRDPFNQSPNALLHHLFTQNPYTKPWRAWSPEAANRLTMLVSLLLLTGWLARAWGVYGRCKKECIDYEHEHEHGLVPLYLAATLLMLLAPSLMWDHYCVQALPALAWLFGQRKTTQQLTRACAALVVFALLALPWRHGEWNAGAGVLLMSLRLWPMLALYIWLLADPAWYAPAQAQRTAHAENC